MQEKSSTAQYILRVQVIRSKGQAPRFFVNVPIPLAAALDLQAGLPTVRQAGLPTVRQAGEQVQWQLLGRSDLRLHRLAAPAAKPKPRNR